MIEVKRRAYTHFEVEELYASGKPANQTDVTLRARLSSWLTRGSLVQFAVARFAAFPRQLIGYKWLDFAADVIAGLTTAFIRIPQGMAYAFLASVQPQYGLYTEFYSCMFYALLATSRHNSVGSTSIMSMLSGDVIEANYPDLSSNASLADVMRYESDKAMFASSFACLIGLMQILLGVCQFHRLSFLFTPIVVKGFTTGLAFYIGTSQLRSMLGIPKQLVPKPTGVGGLFVTWYHICANLPVANVSSVGIALVTVAVCYSTKILSMKYKTKMRNFPIPGELLTVSVMIIFFSFWRGDQSEIDQVGQIPSGLIAPRLIDSSSWSANLANAVPIAIMGYAINLSLAKSFSVKHDYPIDPLQEALAIGTGNALGSVFGTITSTSSLSRTSCQESAGGRTQLASIVSSLLVLLCLLAVGKFFAVIPKACLAGIVIVNLRGMFRQFLQLPPILRYSKIDAAVWLTAFIGTLVFGMIPGLGCSLGAQVAALLYRSTQTRIMPLRHVELIKLTGKTDRHIYALSGSLDFTCVEILTKVPSGKVIILDMSACGYVDWIGFDGLKKLIGRSESTRFCCVSESVLATIVAIDEKYKDNVFPTLTDCIALEEEQRVTANEGI